MPYDSPIIRGAPSKFHLWVLPLAFWIDCLKEGAIAELITEIKLLVYMFYKTDVPIKKSEIVKHIKVSRSTLDKNKEISSYIKEMQGKAKK